MQWEIKVAVAMERGADYTVLLLNLLEWLRWQHTIEDVNAQAVGNLEVNHHHLHPWGR